MLNKSSNVWQVSNVHEYSELDINTKMKSSAKEEFVTYRFVCLGAGLSKYRASGRSGV
jgi:hypothetical protein